MWWLFLLEHCSLLSVTIRCTNYNKIKIKIGLQGILERVPPWKNTSKAISKCAVLLSKFSFPKKRKLSQSFGWQNLFNGETKDFVELWEIIHLKIWTHFSIRQTRLFWITLKHYSQTCPNDHLCKMTTHLRWPMLSPP